jgi:hypothetical protein
MRRCMFVVPALFLATCCSSAVCSAEPANPNLSPAARDVLDYLQSVYQKKVLEDAGIPVLWRPLHEIDGGWFWWTDKEQPENTAKLWRLMYDHFTHTRKPDNLIWVYSAGAGNKTVEVTKTSIVKAEGKGPGLSKPRQRTRRPHAAIRWVTKRGYTPVLFHERFLRSTGVACCLY